MANKYAIYGSDPTQADTGVANGLRETLGPTNLIVGTITDGEFFKRSGNTIISEAISAVSASASSWTTAYSVDFTSLGNQNLKTGGNGAKSIDGKAWTWANDANAATANVVSGSGIVITCNTTNSNYGGPTRTTPILTLPFWTSGSLASSSIANYSVQNHIVRVRLRVLLTSADNNSEGARVIIEDSTAPTNQNVNFFKGFSGGVADQLVAVSTVSATSP